MILTAMFIFVAGMLIPLILFAASRLMSECSGIFRAPKIETAFRPFFAAAGIMFALSLILTGGCAGAVTKTHQISPALAAAEKEKQERIAFEASHNRQVRLSNVSFPLRHAAAPICGEHVKHLSGFFSMSMFDYDNVWRKTAKRYHGLGESKKVIHVDNDSPAHHAGLKAGDELVSIDGKNFPSGKNSRNRWVEIYNNAIQDGEADIMVRRTGRLMNVRIKPVKVCAYNVGMVQNDSVNAFADGENIYITSGMMRFAENDQELALVVAHELAHNAMRHSNKQTQNRIGGAIIGGLISGAACAYGGVCGLQTGMADAAAQMFSKEFEAEADYVGLYIMARAKMDVKGSANFWRKMAAEHPGNIASNHTATHPSTPERFLALEKTVEEIERKQSKGLDLMPDLKE